MPAVSATDREVVGLDRAHRVRSVEGLRAIAAGLVLYYHLQRSIGFTHPGIIPTWLVPISERLGPFGVAIFFALSGFLLYRPFVRFDFGMGPPVRLPSYFTRRFFRIYPAYWCALAVLLFVVGPVQAKTSTDYVVFFGLLQNYRTGMMLRGLGVAWTLVIEVSFYLVLPFLAVLLRSRPGRSTRARVVRQLTGLSLMYCLGLIVRVYSFWYKPNFVPRPGVFQPQWFLESWLPGHLDWFALGMLLAVVACWSEGRDRPLGVVRFAQARAWPLWLGSVTIYFLVTRATFPKPGLPIPHGLAMMTLTVVPIAATLLVAPVVLAPQGAGLIRACLAFPLVVAVGTVSYGIYLWHLVVNLQVFTWIVHRTLPRSAGIQVVLVLTGTMVLATLSYWLVERPCMRLALRLTDGSTRPNRPAAPDPGPAELSPAETT